MDIFAVLSEPRLNSTEKVVLLYCFSNRYEDLCWTEHGRRLSMNGKTFAMAIEGLQAQGYIEVIRRPKLPGPWRGRINVHTLTEKAWALVGLPMPKAEREAVG